MRTTDTRHLGSECDTGYGGADFGVDPAGTRLRGSGLGGVQHTGARDKQGRDKDRFHKGQGCRARFF